MKKTEIKTIVFTEGFWYDDELFIEAGKYDFCKWWMAWTLWYRCSCLWNFLSIKENEMYYIICGLIAWIICKLLDVGY